MCGNSALKWKIISESSNRWKKNTKQFAMLYFHVPLLLSSYLIQIEPKPVSSFCYIVLLEKMLACISHLLDKYRKTACHLWVYPLSSRTSDRVAWFQSDSWWNLFLIHANPVFIMEKLPVLSESERQLRDVAAEGGTLWSLL